MPPEPVALLSALVILFKLRATVPGSWWIIVIQIGSLTTLVHMLFVGLRRLRLNPLVVFSIAALVKLYRVMDGIFMCISLPCWACLKALRFLLLTLRF